MYVCEMHAAGTYVLSCGSKSTKDVFAIKRCDLYTLFS